MSGEYKIRWKEVVEYEATICADSEDEVLDIVEALSDEEKVLLIQDTQIESWKITSFNGGVESGQIR